MTIGIDGSRAFLARRTGIEEYSFQMIRHLCEALSEADVRLYVRKKLVLEGFRLRFRYPEIPFDLPARWRVVGIFAPRFWTQGGLSLEMLFRPVSALFIPAHTVPIIHPARTVVTVHGLEYEITPEAYSAWERFYMRASIRYSVSSAARVVAVSENTKRDLIRLYGVPEGKISVIGEGYAVPMSQTPVTNTTPFPKPSILFIGRLEARKNVARLVEAFSLLKAEGFPHALILVGKPGYGYGRVRTAIEASAYREAICEPGYVDEETKRALLSEASVFAFPSLYEGFGLPVLEAQAAGTPVVASNTSSLPEVGGEGAVYVDPLSVEDIAAGLRKVLQMSQEESAILRKSAEANVRRFTWKGAAEAVGQLLSV